MLQWMTTNYVKEELEEEDNQETTEGVENQNFEEVYDDGDRLGSPKIEPEE